MFVRFIFIFQLSILKTIISALIRRTITIQSQLVLQFTRLNLETPAQLLAVLSFKRNCWNLLTHSWLPSGSASPLMLWSSSWIFYFAIFFFLYIVVSQQGRSLLKINFFKFILWHLVIKLLTSLFYSFLFIELSRFHILGDKLVKLTMIASFFFPYLFFMNLHFFNNFILWC